ncbi:unnamed protein product [Discula destructiva]
MHQRIKSATSLVASEWNAIWNLKDMSAAEKAPRHKPWVKRGRQKAKRKQDGPKIPEYSRAARWPPSNVGASEDGGRLVPPSQHTPLHLRSTSGLIEWGRTQSHDQASPSSQALSSGTEEKSATDKTAWAGRHGRKRRVVEAVINSRVGGLAAQLGQVLGNCIFELKRINSTIARVTRSGAPVRPPKIDSIYAQVVFMTGQTLALRVIALESLASQVAAKTTQAGTTAEAAVVHPVRQTAAAAAAVAASAALAQGLDQKMFPRTLRGWWEQEGGMLLVQVDDRPAPVPLYQISVEASGPLDRRVQRRRLATLGYRIEQAKVMSALYQCSLAVQQLELDMSHVMKRVAANAGCVGGMGGNVRGPEGSAKSRKKPSSKKAKAPKKTKKR